MENCPAPRRMTAAQWQRVKEVTADAIEQDVASRISFVAAACSDDAEVKREVMRLLVEAGRAAEDFLSEAPVCLPQLLEQHTPRGSYFSPGETIAGRFEILQFLNRGGMGEVYGAMDLELREKVALKTIRPAIASSRRHCRARAATRFPPGRPPGTCR